MDEIKSPESDIESTEQKSLSPAEKSGEKKVDEVEATKNTPDNISDIDDEADDVPEDEVGEEDDDAQEGEGLSEQQKNDLQAETGWSDNVVDNINSPEEAQIYKDAGLQPDEVNGKEALVREIDPDLTDEDGISNKDRMERGLAPIDESGEKVELHHIGQHEDSPLAELTTSEHRQGGNDTVLHDKSKETEVHGEGNNWDRERQDYWKDRANDYN